jgi:hypothetical protein
MAWSGIGGVGIGMSANGSCGQNREKGSDGEHFLSELEPATPKEQSHCQKIRVSFSPLKKLMLANDQGAKFKAKE